MRYLIDTHVWLWMLTTPERIGVEASDVIQNGRSALVLSAASSWEIAIKFAMGKLPLPENPDTYVPSRMQATGLESLPISHTHALRVAALPRHHDDPFDRLLVAQAQLERLTLITADSAFESYDVETVRAG